MPDELPFRLDDDELVIVQVTDDLRAEVLVEGSELLRSLILSCTLFSLSRLRR
jgi:hypothetical protein